MTACGNAVPRQNGPNGLGESYQPRRDQRRAGSFAIGEGNSRPIWGKILIRAWDPADTKPIARSYLHRVQGRSWPSASRPAYPLARRRRTFAPPSSEPSIENPHSWCPDRLRRYVGGIAVPPWSIAIRRIDNPRNRLGSDPYPVGFDPRSTVRFRRGTGRSPAGLATQLATDVGSAAAATARHPADVRRSGTADRSTFGHRTAIHGDGPGSRQASCR